MLHEKLQKVLDVFKKEIDMDEENYFIVDDKDFQMFDYLDFVTLNIDPAENEIVDISFYCGCPLPFASSQLAANGWFPGARCPWRAWQSSYLR